MGYWQVPIKASFKDKTAFITYERHNEVTIMPFGLTNALATSQHLMEGVLQGLMRKSDLVYSETSYNRLADYSFAPTDFT